MNAAQITDGGLISTMTFWEVSIPLVVASVIIPVAFSGLLIRIAVQVIRSSYQRRLYLRPFFIAVIFIFFNIASAVVGGRPLFWIVWTLNLLYTIEFLMWAPETYRRALLAPQSLKDAIGPRRNYNSRDSNAARASNYATGSSTARDSRISRDRDSGETENSWASAHSEIVEGSSIANSSNTPYREARQARHKAKNQLVMIVLRVVTISRGAAMIIGRLGLGTAFLVLDILYPKMRGLSVYHSFALWMSLVSVLEVMVPKTLKYMWRRVQTIYERYEPRHSVLRRRRRGSNASQSSRTDSSASDGAV